MAASATRPTAKERLAAVLFGDEAAFVEVRPLDGEASAGQLGEGHAPPEAEGPFEALEGGGGGHGLGGIDELTEGHGVDRGRRQVEPVGRALGDDGALRQLPAQAEHGALERLAGRPRRVTAPHRADQRLGVHRAPHLEGEDGEDGLVAAAGDHRRPPVAARWSVGPAPGWWSCACA